MLTTYFSFIKANSKEVADTICELMGDDYPVTRNDGKLNIDLLPDPNCPRYAKMVLWSPIDGQTVISGNQSDGFHVLCHILSRRYGYNIVMVSLTTDLDNRINNEEIYQCRYFHYLGKSDSDERLVRVMQDPRWDFFEIGEPLPFEQTEKYTERIKKKRLANDMILDYVEAMGYDVRNPDFWKSDNAVYLEWSWIPIGQQNK